MANVIGNALALIRWPLFQGLRQRGDTEPTTYTSKQNRLIDLVGADGTLWLVTIYSEGGRSRRYQLAARLGNCAPVETPEGSQEYGDFTVGAKQTDFFPQNDVTEALLKLRFEPERPISNRFRIGQSLRTVRQLSEDDVTLGLSREK